MASPLLLRTEGELDHRQETPLWPSATTFDPNSPREGGGAMPAQRAYGMDQDLYPWSPIITRPVLRWPDNARVALAVIVNLEHWDWEVPPKTPLAVSPLGGPEGLWSGNHPDLTVIGGYGNHEYGNRVGIFRILAVLDKYGITPTLSLDKAVADHYPFLIQEGQRRDAEFIAHGLSRRHIIHIGMSEEIGRAHV